MPLPVRSCVAVVPLKPFADAKTRLAMALSDAERVALAEAMATHVLATVAAMPDLRVVVVSRDARQREWAADTFGSGVLAEANEGDLNDALRHAARSLGATESMLVVPGDLPLLGLSDLAEAVDLPAPRGIVLAPDRQRRGTNLLHVSHPAEFLWRFGRGSLLAHRSFAKRNGWKVRELVRDGIALDIDEPADLAAYRGRAA